MANDELKISETLEFITQIHKAWDGTEQRASVRYRPRRSISYDYIGTSSWESQYLRSLAYAQQTQLFQIPLWHAIDVTDKDVYRSQATIPLNPRNLWQYRGCSGLILWVDDGYGGDYYSLKTITGEGKLGLGKQLKKNWPAGGHVCPVAWGVLSNTSKITNITSDATSMNLSVEIMKESIAPQFPAAYDEFNDEPVEVVFGKNLFGTQYLSQELFLTPPSWFSDVSGDFTRNAFRLDNESGFFRYDLRSQEPKEIRTVEYVAGCMEEISNLQRFFTRCRGKLHSFWSPTWVQDIDLVEPVSAGQAYMIAKYPYYWKYYATGERRKKIIVFYRDGTAEILTILTYTVTDDGQYSKIYLQEGPSRVLNENSVAMISYLCKYRHDSDSLTMDYESAEAATTSFTYAEVSD